MLLRRLMYLQKTGVNHSISSGLWSFSLPPSLPSFLSSLHPSSLSFFPVAEHSIGLTIDGNTVKNPDLEGWVGDVLVTKPALLCSCYNDVPKQAIRVSWVTSVTLLKMFKSSKISCLWGQQNIQEIPFRPLWTREDALIHLLFGTFLWIWVTTSALPIGLEAPSCLRSILPFSK